jgi:hypothetical protein
MLHPLPHYIRGIVEFNFILHSQTVVDITTNLVHFFKKFVLTITISEGYQNIRDFRDQRQEWQHCTLLAQEIEDVDVSVKARLLLHAWVIDQHLYGFI